MKVLQIISANDIGGGGNHVLNLSFYSKNIFDCTIGAIGEGSLYDKAKSLGINTVRFQSKSAYDGSIVNYVNKNDIDIINFHGAKAFFMHCFLKNRVPVPTVATIHSDYRKDFLNNKIKHMLFTPLSVYGVKSFNNYICVSKYIKRLLENDNFSGNKFLVNNGIDFENIKIKEDRNSIREEYGISEEDFLYINIARMHPIKNQLGLIQAFSKLKSEIENVKLMLVGDGPMEEQLRRKISELHLENSIILTGFRENPVDFINSSEISILTSFSEGGAPPIVILESAAARKAFIAPDVGDIRDIIDENKGFLVDPNSTEDIYNKMRAAYNKKSELNIMGENLKEFSKENYSIYNFCSKYNNAYTNILLEK